MENAVHEFFLLAEMRYILGVESHNHIRQFIKLVREGNLEADIDVWLAKNEGKSWTVLSYRPPK